MVSAAFALVFDANLPELELKKTKVNNQSFSVEVSTSTHIKMADSRSDKGDTRLIGVLILPRELVGIRPKLLADMTVELERLVIDERGPENVVEEREVGRGEESVVDI